MTSTDRRAHWEAIYSSKPFESCSWYQPVPWSSLNRIAAMNLPKNAPLLDVGGGDSFLVDHLLEDGYTDLTVLDISSMAIERAQQRLGEKADRVHWMVRDVTSFLPERTYELWHDRAAFHFLTSAEDREDYLRALLSATTDGSKAIVATFSTNGPTTCSGTVIQRHDEASLAQTFAPDWKPAEIALQLHTTPTGGEQEFLFGVFERQ
jgi:SAM-dependent methyltransferase